MATALHQSTTEPAAEADALTVLRQRAPAVTFAAATLTTIERKLAQHLGPIARNLVQSAALRATSLAELCETLEQRIERPEQRTQFRNEILGDPAAAASVGRAPTGSQAAPPAVRRAVVEAGELRRAEHELVRYVGPIARILVKRAADAASTTDEFWQKLAAHIGGEADRQAFLRGRL